MDTTSYEPIPESFSGVKAGRRCASRMRRQKPGARIFARSNSFVPPRVRTVRKNFFAKRRMRAGRCVPRLRDEQVRLSELEVTCYAKSPNMVCVSEFDERGIFSPRPGRV